MNPTPEQLDNVKIMRDMLIVIDDKSFDITIFIRDQYSQEPDEEFFDRFDAVMDCGTIACACGWYELLIKENSFLDDKGLYRITSVTALEFGMIEEESEWVFSGVDYNYKTQSHKDRRWVINQLDEYLALGTFLFEG